MSMRPNVVCSRLVRVAKSAKRLCDDRRRAVFSVLVEVPVEPQRVVRLGVTEPAREAQKVVTASNQ